MACRDFCRGFCNTFLIGPRLSPPPILTRTIATSLPRIRRTRNGIAVDINNGPGKSVLNVVVMILVGHKLGNLGATGATITMPLRHRRPILQAISASEGIARQLCRNRRRTATQSASDLADTHMLGVQYRDPFTFAE
jgi:hypothetical protein